jgi:hypothetical protein
MSIEFNPLATDWDTTRGERCRVVRKAELVEVSAVFRPAFASTWMRAIDLRTAPPFGAMIASGQLRREVRGELLFRSEGDRREAADRLSGALARLQQAVA